MRYTPREKDTTDSDDQLFFSLEPLIRGVGMSLVELNVFRSKKRGARHAVPHDGRNEKRSYAAGDVKIRVIVYKGEITGVEDCTKVHRLIMPRLELAFPGQDISLEVSSPGINRVIKDGSEFIHYIGRRLNCYRTDISDWTAGILLAVDDKKIELLGGVGEITLPYEIIAKARLDGAALPKSDGGI